MRVAPTGSPPVRKYTPATIRLSLILINTAFVVVDPASSPIMYSSSIVALAQGCSLKDTFCSNEKSGAKNSKEEESFLKSSTPCVSPPFSTAHRVAPKASNVSAKGVESMLKPSSLR